MTRRARRVPMVDALVLAVLVEGADELPPRPGAGGQP